MIQHTEYMAFGETFVDEHSVSPMQPYLFNGKELDYETGLYYYGARYYDPKVSIFLNVDPLVEKTGTPYAYTYNNPINLIDPTGMESEGWGLKDNKWEWKSDLTAENYKELGYSDYRDDGSIITNTAIAGKEDQNTGLTYLGYNGKAEYIDYKKVALNLISAIWNSDYVRDRTGDFFSIGVGFSGIAGTGGGTSFDLNWVLHGPEASIYPAITTTTSIGGGYSVDATINIGLSRYTGKASDISRGMFETKTHSGDYPTVWNSAGPSIGAKIGTTGNITKLREHSIIGGKFNIGLGLPLGKVPFNGAGGVSNTFMIKDFKKK